MGKSEKEIFTINDIKDAYRKLKTHFYYDNTNHFMRRQIAEFETGEDFDNKLQQLVEDLNNENKDLLIEKYVNDINYYLQPKGFENNILEKDCESLIVTNRYISERYELKNFNYFIKIPIELHIVNVLWIVKLGYLLDSQYCYYSDNTKSYCYANRLELDEKNGKVLFGNKLFKTYANQYQKWRDNCISTAEDLLDNHKKDVIIVSLDIKRYYPSADLDYNLINQDLELRCKNKDLLEEFKKYSFLTNIIGQVRDIYFEKTRPIWENEQNEVEDMDKLKSEHPIPIGMLSSNIIANWYLRTFDEKVNKYVKPTFYGRYVDDILIVLENRGGCSELTKKNGQCDKNCCSDKRKLTIDKILSQYFCGCNDKSCPQSILIKEPIKNDNACESCKHINNERRKKDKYNYLIKINNNNLRIQGNKVKLFVFDANSTKAMLQKFKDTIKKHSSEFRFLPEEDRIQEDFVQETYSIDYNDTINKLRSIDKYQLDRFKISSYLAKQLMLSKYSTDKEYFNNTKEELLFAFSGRMGLELFLFWDKVLTYFILNDNSDVFCEFIQKMLNNIKRIAYKNKNALKIVQEELINYLKESIYLSLSLNPNFIYKDKNKNNDYILKQTFKKLIQNDEIKEIFENKIYKTKITQLTKAVMIKHKYCFMPILNYIKIDGKYIDFTNANILELDQIPELLDRKSNKIKFNPKRFSFDEIILYENYKKIFEYPQNTEKFNINLSAAIDNTITKYITLNLTQYENSSVYKDKMLRISNYLKNCKKNFPNEENSNDKIITLNINKDNYPPKLSNFKIGLYNTKIPDDSILENLKSQPKLSFNELQTYIKFLNLAIQNNKIKCDMIIFPEVCIPYQALGLLSDFSKKHKVAIICGLKHITIKNTVLNCIATILPFSIGHYTDSYTNLRLKEWYSPAEIKEIKKLGKELPDSKEKQGLTNNLFCWNNLYFAIYDCFELADVNYRSNFKSEVDMIIACEWNRDIDYFNNIIKSASRDLHCYTIQVNTSQFGDSKVIAPKKTSEMTMLNIKGGENNILIGHINIEELRDFQRKETEYLDEKDKIFKPLPPAFNKNTERLNVKKP